MFVCVMCVFVVCAMCCECMWHVCDVVCLCEPKGAKVSIGFPRVGVVDNCNFLVLGVEN